MQDGLALNSASEGSMPRSQLSTSSFWWPWECSSIVRWDVPWLPLYCTWRQNHWSLPLALASHELLTNMSSEDVRNCICRQCGTGKDHVSAYLRAGSSPRELSATFSGWKLVCSSRLRQEFLRSRWIELRDTWLLQKLHPVSNEILWKWSVQAVSMWKVSSSQRSVHA